MSFGFWQKWLSIAAGVVVATGLFPALAGFLPYSEPVNRLINQTFRPERTVGAEIGDFQHWVYGIMGATIAGWGVLLLFVTRVPLRRKSRGPGRRYRSAWPSGSRSTPPSAIYHGVYLNAAFNTILAIAIGLPVVVAGRFFRSS